MLGADLAASKPEEVELHAYDRSRLDILDFDAVEAALDDLRPEFLINATGFTAVDRAEHDRTSAFAVNAAAVAGVGRLSMERSVGVVHFSTDYVFDGHSRRAYREEDPVAPLNVYGESKVAGEQGLLASGANALILRTQWLFGINGPSFPRTMWERATRGLQTRVVNDQFGRPTYTLDLARATWACIAKRVHGIYHVANAGEASWFDVAHRVFDAAGSLDLLSPCSSEEFPRVARRPARSVLSTTKLEDALGAALPHWTTALSDFLTRLSALERLNSDTP